MPEIDSAHLPAPLPLYIDRWTLMDECRIYMFFTLFGYWPHGGGGGGSQGMDTQPAHAVFHPRQLQNGRFQNLFF